VRSFIAEVGAATCSDCWAQIWSAALKRLVLHEVHKLRSSVSELFVSKGLPRGVAGHSVDASNQLRLKRPRASIEGCWPNMSWPNIDFKVYS